MEEKSVTPTRETAEAPATAPRSRRLPLGVVVRKRPGVTRWAKWHWRPVAVLPGAAPAHWAEIARDGDTVDYHAATLTLELWRSDTEAYLTTLAARTPSVAVVMRASGDPDRPWDAFKVTASAFESQDYQDSGEELVELVPMPPGLFALVQAFCDAHHVDEPFVKRQRRGNGDGAAEDGKGDPRIRQMSDVYRAPRREQKQ